MKNLSYIEERSQILLPENTGERVYMLEFYKKNGLPAHLSRWQKTVDQLLDGIDTEGLIYLMIDQGFVQAGKVQRRGGVHIDGYWQPALSAHNSIPTESETPSSPRHNHTPSTHNHKPFEYDKPVVPIYDNHSHVPTTRKIKFGNVDLVEWPTESIILASDIQACRGWNGLYDHSDMPGGDCSHVNVQELQEMMFRKNTVYLGNVTMLHESLPVLVDTLRTVIRLNVPGYNPPALN